jgi:hypothetical protein
MYGLVHIVHIDAPVTENALDPSEANVKLGTTRSRPLAQSRLSAIHCCHRRIRTIEISTGRVARRLGLIFIN